MCLFCLQSLMAEVYIYEYVELRAIPLMKVLRKPCNTKWTADPRYTT
ncbi:hypothetical protein HMPREF1057_02774 [Bacteroides finegoldii CL09T03C10]|uniref:Uncharacterized protein n=1 Tax=Bacteroides finegoldii CL09T03C10 TaxID=997888 RepID=K5CAZ5_9BACE|nr:hypothetical protein HMPREF1057_02774 [Bacteroides finegoldii CL09T03C10]